VEVVVQTMARWHIHSNVAMDHQGTGKVDHVRIHWSEVLHEYRDACHNCCTIQARRELDPVEEEVHEDGLPKHFVMNQDCHEVCMACILAVVVQVKDYLAESALRKTQQEAFLEKVVMVPQAF
jgi:hypothetical protein